MSILLWAAGYVAGRMGDTVIERITNQNLDDKLIRVVNSWITQYDFKGLSLEAFQELFDWDNPEITESQPHRRKISKEMTLFHIPTADMWLGALQERFVEIQIKFPKPEDRQAFFKQPLEDVLPAFEDLAKSLHNTCSQEEDFFRISVISKLNQLTELINNEDRNEIDKKNTLCFCFLFE